MVSAMKSKSEPIARLLKIGKPFWVSQQRFRAQRLLFSIISLLVAVALVNVWTNSIAGNFMTALEHRNQVGAYGWLALYLLAIVMATPIIAFYQAQRTKLALVWRKWFTEHLLEKYFSHRAYVKLTNKEEIDNPDARMQDIDSFCNMSVGLTISVIDACINVITFSFVLWHISKLSWLVVIGYSIAGCYLTLKFGRLLPRLNDDHLRLEGDFRSSLLDVRRDAYIIAQGGASREQEAKGKIVSALSVSIANLEAIMMLNRNLAFFTTGFNLLPVIIPAALAAPIFFAGGMEFGDITRATMAFQAIFGAMTLIVSQFNALSGYAALVNRLHAFLEALDFAQYESDSEPLICRNQVSTVRSAFWQLFSRKPRAT